MEEGLEVAGHSIVACGVDTVGGQLHFQTVVAFYVEIACGRGACSYAVGEHHYSVVAVAETNFVFGADHAVGFHSADL